MVDHDNQSKDVSLVAYRTRWEQRGAERGGPWQEYAPAFDLAWDLAHTTGIQYGRSWADVAPEFERQWLLRGDTPTWERVADLMRQVWEDASDHGGRILHGDEQAPQPERHART